MMKVTTTTLKSIGLQHLVKGTPTWVPYFFRKYIDLIYQDDEQIIAFMAHRYLNDHHIHARVMILLNQLVRYYQRQVVLYCLSYRALISHEKIYLTFKKIPTNKEN